MIYETNTNQVTTHMNKQIIRIVYSGDDEPTVTLPPGMNAEIKLINADEEESLVLEHGGLSIYWTIDDEYKGHVERWSENTLCTQPREFAYMEHTFTKDDLPDVPKKQAAKYRKLFPEDEDNQKIAYAIDQGWITEDGLNLKKDH